MWDNATKKGIGLLLSFLILMGGNGVPPVHAEVAPPLPDLVKTCQDTFPAFKNDEPFTLPEARGLTTPDQLAIALEQFQNQYHGYLQCIFDGAVQEILGSSGADTDGFWSANSPNMPEWLVPDLACLEPDKLAKATGNTGTDKLLPVALKAYNAYSRFLSKLYKAYEENLVLSRADDASAFLQQSRNIVVNELQDSLAALSSTFSQLTEFRQVFVMHVQFQCMLRNLEEYRTFLGKIRSIVLLLPARIIDASTVK